MSTKWGRSPQGERGLKLPPQTMKNVFSKSLSARRAWIEIRLAAVLNVLCCCRSPQGERGLKLSVCFAAFACAAVALRKESVD